jgi:hypothetical protein
MFPTFMVVYEIRRPGTGRRSISFLLMQINFHISGAFDLRTAECTASDSVCCGRYIAADQNLCLNPSETPVLLGRPSYQLRLTAIEIEL